MTKISTDESPDMERTSMLTKYAIHGKTRRRKKQDMAVSLEVLGIALEGCIQQC